MDATAQVIECGPSSAVTSHVAIVSLQSRENDPAAKTQASRTRELPNVESDNCVRARDLQKLVANHRKDGPAGCYDDAIPGELIAVISVHLLNHKEIHTRICLVIHPNAGKIQFEQIIAGLQHEGGAIGGDTRGAEGHQSKKRGGKRSSRGNSVWVAAERACTES
jgi:hypothetical protein